MSDQNFLPNFFFCGRVPWKAAKAERGGSAVGDQLSPKKVSEHVLLRLYQQKNSAFVVEITVFIAHILKI